MKLYKELSPTDRRIMLLKTVAFDNAMEGMSSAKTACLNEIQELQKTKTQKTITPRTLQKKPSA